MIFLVHLLKVQRRFYIRVNMLYGQIGYLKQTWMFKSHLLVIISFFFILTIALYLYLRLLVCLRVSLCLTAKKLQCSIISFNISQFINKLSNFVISILCTVQYIIYECFCLLFMLISRYIYIYTCMFSYYISCIQSLHCCVQVYFCLQLLHKDGYSYFKR